MKIFSFESLSGADLIVDAVYEGGNSGSIRDEPISRLIQGVGNMGGFRYSGSEKFPKIVVLYTTNSDRDWPDSINPSTGVFIYYGDNKKPGHLIHDTPKKGNLLLKNLFDSTHSDTKARDIVPPILVFMKRPTIKSARSVQFIGLAVPGCEGYLSIEDLVAVWKTSDGQRFQNYRAIFTILNIPVITRSWLNSIQDCKLYKNAPDNFIKWKKHGSYSPLKAAQITNFRLKKEQLPKQSIESGILKEIVTIQHLDRQSQVIFH